MHARQGSTRALIVPAFVVAGSLLVLLSGGSSSNGLSPLAACDAVEDAPGVKSATVTTATDRESLVWCARPAGLYACVCCSGTDF